MRRLIVSIHSTANNIVTGPPSGDETDFMQWAQPGIEDSLDRFLSSLDGVDTILLGRGTYQDLVRKWPLVATWPDVSDTALRIGEKINTTPKIVVSGQPPRPDLDWGDFEPPTQFTGANVEEQVAHLKETAGGDIITFGSPVLVRALTNAGLVDLYRILVHPVVVHEGRPLFANLSGRTDLHLQSIETFTGGAILVSYQRQDSPATAATEDPMPD